MLRKRSRIETEDLIPGTFVWAQLKANDWWPGLIIDSEDAGLGIPKAERFHVFWFGDYRVSEVSIKNICDFKDYFSFCFKSRKHVPVNWSKGVAEAIRELGYPHTANWKEARLLRWALDHFPSEKFNFSFDKRIPEFVSKRLAEIKAMNTNSILEGNNTRIPTAKEKLPEESLLANAETNFKRH